MTIQPCKKLDQKFHRPFRILGIVGKKAYRLKLPLRLKIHLAFHGLLLELANMTQGDVNNLPPPLEVDSKEEYYVEDICNSKYQ